MNILVTGSNGFIGKNLIANLRNIQEGKNKTRPNLQINNVYECSRETSIEQLETFCKDSDYVIHLAGVNRPHNESEYLSGNTRFTEELIRCMKTCTHPPKVIFASSVQAILLGRYKDSIYGRSKLACEKRLFEYEKETAAEVFIYRFPNVYGKWCKPDYNSAVATFCHCVANDLPYRINNENTRLELLYIDDLMEEIYNCLEGKLHRCNYMGLDLIASVNGEFCFVPKTSFSTLGNIIGLLKAFKKQPETLVIPNVTDESFAKKLYATFLSYLPRKDFVYPLKMNINKDGSFTELIRSAGDGQLSVNITKPGVVKGQHWHNTKWEIFVVVSGHGLVQQRKYGDSEVWDFEVSGEKLQALQIPPGYVHNLINLSEEEDLITLIWANEQFDPNRPDTYRENVK